MLNKFGVENAMQFKEINERAKNTCTERHGGIGFQSESIKRKI